MIGDKDQAIVDQITTAVRSRMVEWYGDGTVLLADNPSYWQTSAGYFFRYGLKKPDQSCIEVLIKIQTEEYSLSQAVDRQDMYTKNENAYGKMQLIEKTITQLADARLTAVPTLDFLPQWHGIAMEWVPMNSLRSEFLDKFMRLGSPWHWKKFCKAIARAGIWLRVYHDRMGVVKAASVPINEFRVEIDQVLDGLANCSQEITFLPLVRKAFTQVLDSLADSTVPMGELHGDFTLGNTYIAPDGKVGGIDFEGVTRGPTYRDISRLIVDIEVHKALRHGYIVYFLRLQRCIAVFLEGYYQSKNYDRQALNLFCGLEVIKRWLRFETSMLNSRGVQRKIKYISFVSIRMYMRYLLLNKYLQVGNKDYK
jgi:hypothetical protein